MSIFVTLYNSLMQSRKAYCSFGNLEYWETHHIIPKCIGGSDDENNLVLLTAREHYIAHWLLTKMHPKNKKIHYAFTMMCSLKDKRRFTTKQYERMKTVRSNLMTGHEVTEETRKKISEKCTGYKHTKEAIEKIRQTSIGRSVGKTHTKEAIEKIKQARALQFFSEESLQKRRDSLKKSWIKRIAQNPWLLVKEDGEEILMTGNINKKEFLDDKSEPFSIFTLKKYSRLGKFYRGYWYKKIEDCALLYVN